MPGPIAEAFVRINPETTTFPTRLRTAVVTAVEKVARLADEQFRRHFDPEVEVEARLDAGGVITQLQSINALLGQLGDVTLTVGVEDDEAQARILALHRAIAGVRDIDVAADVDTVDAQAKVARLQAALEAIEGATADVDLDTVVAEARLAELRAALADIDGTESVDIDLDSGAALAKIAALKLALKSIDDETVNVDVDTGSAVSKLGLFNRDAETAATRTSDLRRALITLAGGAGVTAASIQLLKFPAIVSGASLAVGAVGALTGALVALAASLGPLAGLAPAAAAGLIAVGQAAGVAKLAFVGVGDALSAYVKAEKDIASGAPAVRAAAEATARAHEAAARRVEAAQLQAADARVRAARMVETAQRGVVVAERTLERSQRSVRDAQEDLNRARAESIEQLRDLEERVNRGALSEERAVLNLERARQALRELGAQAGGFTGTDRREALLRIAEAELDLQDVQRQRQDDQESLNEAQQRGVEGDEDVIDARQRLTDAEVAAADASVALVEAQKDVGEAHRNAAREIADAARELATAQRDQARATATNTSATEDALAGQSAAARALITTIAGLRPAFEQLQAVAQQAMFPGLIAAINTLSPLMGALQPVVASTAGVIGNFAARMAEVVAAPAFSGPFIAMLEANVGLFSQLADAMVRLAPAILTLVVTAAPLLQTFVDLIVRASDAFGAFILRTSETGGLEAFFGETRDIVLLLTEGLGALAGVLGDVGRAAYDVGKSFLGSMVEGLVRLNQETGSAKGQAGLAGFFESIREPAEAIGRLLRDVAVGLGGLFAELSPQIGPVIDQLRTELLPAILDLLGTFDAEFLGALVSLATAAVRFIETFATATPVLTAFTETLAWMLGFAVRIVDALGPFGDILVNILAALSAVGVISGIITIVAALGRLFGILVGFKKIVSIVTVAAKALATGIALISAPVLAVIAAIGAAIAIGYLLYRNWGTVTKAAAALGGALADAAGAVGRFFTRLPGLITGALGDLGGLLLDVGESLLGGLTTGAEAAVGGYIGFWIALPGRILGALGDIASFLIDAGGKLLGGLLSGAGNVLGAVLDFFGGLPGRIIGAMSDLAGVVGRFFSSAFSGLRSIVGEAVDGIVDFFVKLPGRITGLVGELLEAGRKIGGSIYDGILKGFGVAADFAKGLANAVIGFVNDKLIATINNAFVFIAERLADVNIPGVGRGFDAAANVIKAIRVPLIPKLYEGGLIKGSPSGTVVSLDGIPVVAGDRSRDEVVMPLPPGFLDAIMAIAKGTGSAPMIGEATFVSPNPIATARQVGNRLRSLQASFG